MSASKRLSEKPRPIGRNSLERRELRRFPADSPQCLFREGLAARDRPLSGQPLSSGESFWPEASNKFELLKAIKRLPNGQGQLLCKSSYSFLSWAGFLCASSP